MRILIVDDEQGTRFALSHLVRSMGHQPIEASTGEEAIQKLIAELPDLLLLDIMLAPGGLTGWDVARYKIADERTKNIPVIVISALSSFAIHAGAQTNVLAGAIIVLGKPVDPHLLYDAIRAVENPP